MPSWATRLSSSWVAGRASRAAARKRSSPASQALAMASLCGGTPVEPSHLTRLTTARAMWRAIPERRRSSSEMRAAGSWGAGLGGLTALVSLDSVASFAIGRTIRVLAGLGLRVYFPFVHEWGYPDRRIDPFLHTCRGPRPNREVQLCFLTKARMRRQESSQASFHCPHVRSPNLCAPPSY